MPFEEQGQTAYGILAPPRYMFFCMAAKKRQAFDFSKTKLRADKLYNGEIQFQNMKNVSRTIYWIK